MRTLIPLAAAYTLALYRLFFDAVGVDGDGDGELDVACGGLDCDDADPTIGPGAPDEPDA